jgi:ABC-type dipeptide/oligopeptide/nickel transport system permease subunit
MGRFLRENWPWIVVPAAIFLVLIVVLILVTGDGGSSPFIYNVFD